MPGMNGVEVFMNVKQYSPKTVVFMMTAFAEEELIKKALREGAYACMSKPVNIENIMEAIKNLKNKNAVLIVDDDVRFAESLSKILGDNGLAVKTAPTGAQAISEITNAPYKVVLLNMKLPDVNGIELYSQIKAINPDTSVVMMTGCESDQNTTNIINKGGYLCLQKPFDPGTLIDLVKKHASLLLPPETV
jgi:DNA-binding NtrC family response regulator